MFLFVRFAQLSNLNKNTKEFVMKFECPCGYVYDPEEGDFQTGIEPGTLFEDLPEDWVCPWCGAEKEYFEPVE